MGQVVSVRPCTQFDDRNPLSFAAITGLFLLVETIGIGLALTPPPSNRTVGIPIALGGVVVATLMWIQMFNWKIVFYEDEIVTRKFIKTVTHKPSEIVSLNYVAPDRPQTIRFGGPAPDEGATVSFGDGYKFRFYSGRKIYGDIVQKVLDVAPDTAMINGQPKNPSAFPLT